MWRCWKFAYNRNNFVGATYTIVHLCFFSAIVLPSHSHLLHYILDPPIYRQRACLICFPIFQQRTDTLAKCKNCCGLQKNVFPARVWLEKYFSWNTVKKLFFSNRAFTQNTLFKVWPIFSKFLSSILKTWIMFILFHIHAWKSFNKIQCHLNISLIFTSDVLSWVYSNNCNNILKFEF